MKRRLFIHVGVHRTATSSIQSFLRGNIKALQTAGYFNLHGVGRNFFVFKKIFSGALAVDDVSAEIEKRANGKTETIHSVVLSDEDVCMQRDLSVLQDFSKHFDVKILFSMRRQDLWLESWHQQNVKWQWNPSLSHLTFSEFLERREEFHWIHYDRVCAHLAELFGRENLILRIFEKHVMPEGPVAAFCEDLGILDTALFTEPSRLNYSNAPIVSEFTRMLPLDEVPPKYRRHFEAAILAVNNHLSTSSGSSSMLLMDSDTRERVLDEYHDGNALVAKVYFGRDALFLDPMPDKDAPVAHQNLPSDSYDLMRDFVVPMIRDLARQMEADDKQRDKPAAKD